MLKIKPRDDGFFEKKGTDTLKYKSKQAMKKSLEAIGEKEDTESLEEALSEIPEDHFFKGHPYLQGRNVMCRLHKPPKEAYLGHVDGYITD